MSSLPPTPGSASGLTERERALLDFERDWRVHQGAKEAAIRERFGVSPARYYQLLARLVEREAARRHDPLTVTRLRRRRDERERSRAARTLRQRSER